MEFDISGMDELAKILQNLPLEEKEENSIVNKAAKLVQEAAIEEAPVDERNEEDSGTLKRNIKLMRAREGVARVHTGGAYHAHLVEFGRSGGSKTAVKSGKSQKVTWGDTVPNPFFTRAFQKTKGEAQKVMAEELKKRLNL